LPPPTTVAAAGFTIGESPFAATGPTDAITLEQAIAAAMQPVAALEGQQQGQAAKRPLPAGAPQQHWGGKHRPPRPPAFADSGSLVLDVIRSGDCQQQPLVSSPLSQSIRSPRSSSGGAASPGGGRPIKQSSKTQGRVCI
jgi:hypothetical protein